jgi:hypothetical protein
MTVDDPGLVVFTYRNDNGISINGLDGFPIGSEDFNFRESGSHRDVTVILKSPDSSSGSGRNLSVCSIES